MAKWVCKLCIMNLGLKGTQLDQWPDQGDLDGIADHIEAVHHMAVQRGDETKEQALTRFADSRCKMVGNGY